MEIIFTHAWQRFMYHDRTSGAIVTVLDVDSLGSAIDVACEGPRSDRLAPLHGTALLYLGGDARNLYFGKCGVATLLGLTLVTCD